MRIIIYQLRGVKMKKIFFLCLILIVLFSFASVSASDINDTTIVNYINKNQDSSVIQSTQSENTFSDLNKTINDDNLSIIYLNQNYKYDHSSDYNFSKGIEIKKNVTINGNGHIIDGNNQARIFKVSKGNVIFNNITFINGKENNGGAISGTLILYNNSPIYQIQAFNCQFINNTATGSGGAVYRVSTVNCIFINNSARFNGGAICYGNSSNCTFINNFASESGGSMFIAKYQGLNFNNNYFYNSSSKSGGAIFFKGGIVDGNSYSKIKNCTFVNCYSSYDGGAIFASEFDEDSLRILNLHISDCEFNNCYSTNRSGGAIYWGSYNGICNNCNFLNCFSNISGGAIRCNFDFDLNYCSFINCISKNGGGFYADLNADQSILNKCLFKNCSAEECGGALFLRSDNIKLNNNMFIYNYAYNGGAVYFDEISNNCTLYNCSIFNNSAKTMGGALYVNGHLHEVINCNFKFNTALYDDDYNINTNVINCSGHLENHSIIWIHRNSGGIYNSSFNRISSKIISSSLTTVYNIKNYLIINLKDDKNNPIINAPILININGLKSINSDNYGKVKMLINGIIPKRYSVIIKFNGNDDYEQSTKTITVVVKKATPKLTAKAKTFTKSVKTKKYTITLKNNLNKVMKNTKVTIKVNKKTYTAKTNKKGIATFKITKLNKKGTFKSIITYAGDKYYNKVTKSVNIKVK